MAVPSDHQHRRSKKSKNGQKKQPQRGLGVAQLERLRIQEESKKAMLASSSFAAAGSCFQAQQGRVSALCLSAPHNPPLHLHHISPAQQGSGGGAAAAYRPSNLPFLASLGTSASSRQHHKASLDPNLANISQHSVIHQLDHALMAKIHGQASADSSSCKSGISSDVSAAATVAASHHLFGRRSGRSSSSPSPCSSQHNSKPDHVFDESDESSRGAAAAAAPPFVFLGSSSSCSSEANHRNTTIPLMIQPGSSSNNIIKDNLPESSEMFDPLFRTRARRVYGDGRDWPGIHTHGIPAIKELSSFQIPGNTIPALSSPNKACWTGARDGVADLGSGYSGSVDKGSSVKMIATASSSPRSLSAASSWARSEVCFSFEQQLKDSCSSSLKNAATITNSSTNLEATSSTKPASCDFLTLALAAPDPRPQFHKRPSSGLPDLKPDDDESSKFAVTTPQEASGETDDHWLLKNHHQLARKSIKLQHFGTPSMVPASPFMLDLSLKVPSIEESSLELKLAL
ncbi:hypothetical protein SELMODRAFT_411605 [Selaginella moellendorffii]|uniref:Uncharacterized protein n=1 Tax=Selaginella moellendorffii TaxID=88036 RepID=D8RIG8_SELML|nr:uncharacterized protein LOC9641310 [Selaginella moellendorffii]EFJ28091.1 hypothetical protein SELMODRAFT_411605 [Selaginella moellendorffii]|eukprot:XP_002970765.1 uncharacterized protein LOC9641310 [Selaginella moellendorffii]